VEFVFDVERRRRLLRDSVHYNGGAASRRAAETSLVKPAKASDAILAVGQPSRRALQFKVLSVE
jgi:hypothetical protein